MSKTSDVDFELVFNALPKMLLILDTKLIVRAVTNFHLKNTLKTRLEVIGGHVMDVFVENPKDELHVGKKNLLASFAQVLSSEQPHVMDVLKYDIVNKDGTYEDRFWSIENHPVFDTNGKVIYIANVTENITKLINAQQKELVQQSIVESQKQELIQINGILKSQYENIRQISTEKSAIISNVSHEMRTPLSGIIGYCELLKMTNLDDEQTSLVQMTALASDKLSYVVNNIMEVSKLEAGEMKLIPSSFNPVVVVRDVVRDTQSFAEENQNTVILTNDEQSDQIYVGDVDKFRQIIQNLVMNAIKFTVRGKVIIDIWSQTDNDDTIRLFVTIQDTGIGIPKEKQDKLFTPFVQIDNSDTRKFQGAGLGLTIVKNLVELMNGKVNLSSQERIGTKIIVMIPLNISIQISSKTANTLVDALNGKTVLIVDDDKIIQQLLKKISQKLSMQSFSAINGKIAVDMYQKNHFDVILMDIQMPEMDGFEATKQIREIEKNLSMSRTPIITMSASSMVSDRVKSYSAGMDFFLPKPFTLPKLKEVLLRFL